MRRLLPLLLWAAACGPTPDATPEIVVIPAGASVRAVADSLRAHRVIQSRLWFRLVARARGYDRKLQRGTYGFARGAGSVAVLRVLVEGRSLQARFTVPEGFTLVDIAEAAERELDLPRAAFLAAARDSGLLREFGVPAVTFEGFLRPDTYLFPRGVSAEAVIREMAETFRAQWDSSWDLAGQAQRLDRLALVTLGSIVEAEARADSDRALIAAVYRNRIHRGMALQADATVQYAIQLATGARKLRLYEKDYGFPSPYNTYLHAGLPPGPIGAPGRKSLEAVINPAQVPYLYYVARPDGRHVFSRTYAEHLRAVSRVRRAP